jgi:hypothetical protein
MSSSRMVLRHDQTLIDSYLGSGDVRAGDDSTSEALGYRPPRKPRRKTNAVQSSKSRRRKK